MKAAQRITAFITCLIVLTVSSLALGQRMMPERNEFGATWGQYLAEPKNTLDVLFIGSSIAYCDIKPAIIYEKTGIKSYMMCGPELTSSLSYYYLKEALKTQSPSAVFVEATSFFFGKYTGSTKINVGYMPYSLSRFQASLNASEKEQRLGLFFPLYNYHSRWNDDQITYAGKRGDSLVDMAAGYTFLDEAVPQEGRSVRNYNLSDEQLSENLEWLGRIKRLCDDQGIRLVLFIAPQCAYPSEELTNRLKDAAGDTVLINHNDVFDELDLDLQQDFHDSLHLNCFGAEKYSAAVADTLRELDIGASQLSDELWDSRVRYEKEHKVK